MLPTVTYLDLETTGATPLKDRITEIALVRFKGGVEVARWQTLVNPEMPIPIFIQQLTGITNEMVQDAPRFKEVAGMLAEYLEGAVMAAHNVRFDHGFLKSEYKRLGHVLRQKVICTVKLSRRLYPEYRSHSLDAIMQRHELRTEARHRAMSDVDLMIGFVQSAERELGMQAVSDMAQALAKRPSLPSHIDPHVVDEIPETAGVYLFYGDNDLPLYIGKSVNLRERVLSHFSGDHASTKEMRLSQELKRIEWIQTAGELGALLLESRLVKERQPIHNRQLRRERQLCAWQIEANPETIPQINLIGESDIKPDKLNQLFGTFRSKKQAIEAIRNITDQHQLCPRILGLETGKGRCFASQLKKCKGACCGKEPLAMHQLRLMQALAECRLKSWPHAGTIAIKEYCESSKKTEIHFFNQWCHLSTVKDETDYYEALEDNNQRTVLKFDHDTYRLLSKALNDGKLKLIPVASNRAFD
jgi:DNA polymerase-3 subunit epsilon